MDTYKDWCNQINSECYSCCSESDSEEEDSEPPLPAEKRGTKRKHEEETVIENCKRSHNVQHDVKMFVDAVYNEFKRHENNDGVNTIVLEYNATSIREAYKNAIKETNSIKKMIDALRAALSSTPCPLTLNYEVVDAKQQATQHTIRSSDAFSVGRHPCNDIAVLNGFVSRVQCLLIPYKDKDDVTRIAIVDFFSMNGTVVRQGNTTKSKQVNGNTIIIDVALEPFTIAVGEETILRFNTKTCVICMENKRDVVFRPCNHFVCCEHCSSKLTNCPLCRAVINNKTRDATGNDLNTLQS